MYLMLLNCIDVDPSYHAPKEITQGFVEWCFKHYPRLIEQAELGNINF